MIGEVIRYGVLAVVLLFFGGFLSIAFSSIVHWHKLDMNRNPVVMAVGAILMTFHAVAVIFANLSEWQSAWPMRVKNIPFYAVVACSTLALGFLVIATKSESTWRSALFTTLFAPAFLLAAGLAIWHFGWKAYFLPIGVVILGSLAILGLIILFWLIAAYVRWLKEFWAIVQR